MRVLAISHQRDAGPGVFAEPVAKAGATLDIWHVAETDEPPGDPLGYDAVLTFGASANADQEDEHAWLRPEKDLLPELVAREVPLLGVCLGSQLVAEAIGGSAGRAPEPEIGWYAVEVTLEGAEDPIVAPLSPEFEAFQWHSYECRLPADATVLARSPVCVQAYRRGRAAGIQFHAEVTAADAAKWTREFEEDADAVKLGIDPEVLAAETQAKIEAWNEVGRAMCGRWLESALAP